MQRILCLQNVVEEIYFWEEIVMSKSEEIENMVLKLYDLVLNPEIKEKERILLIDAKTGLEKVSIILKS